MSGAVWLCKFAFFSNMHRLHFFYRSLTLQTSHFGTLNYYSMIEHGFYNTDQGRESELYTWILLKYTSFTPPTHLLNIHFLPFVHLYSFRLEPSPDHGRRPHDVLLGLPGKFTAFCNTSCANVQPSQCSTPTHLNFYSTRCSRRTRTTR